MVGEKIRVNEISDIFSWFINRLLKKVIIYRVSTREMATGWNGPVKHLLNAASPKWHKYHSQTLTDILYGAQFFATGKRKFFYPILTAFG